MDAEVMLVEEKPANGAAIGQECLRTADEGIFEQFFAQQMGLRQGEDAQGGERGVGRGGALPHVLGFGVSSGEEQTLDLHPIVKHVVARTHQSHEEHRDGEEQ